MLSPFYTDGNRKGLHEIGNLWRHLVNSIALGKAIWFKSGELRWRYSRFDLSYLLSRPLIINHILKRNQERVTKLMKFSLENQTSLESVLTQKWLCWEVKIDQMISKELIAILNPVHSQSQIKSRDDQKFSPSQLKLYSIEAKISIWIFK